MKIVALTGSLGSGKSAVSGIFEELGATIIDSDILAREVVTPGSPGFTKVIERFGRQYVLPSGQLDRKSLGELVFRDREQLKILEDIIHPLIVKRSEELVREISQRNEGKGLIVRVIPLYFESKFEYPEIQKVIVVTAPKLESIRRVMKRDNCSAELAIKKYSSQIPVELKAKRADIVINNDSDLESLRKKVEKIYNELMQ